MVGGRVVAGNIGATMDALGTALGNVTGLRVFDFPPKSAHPPFAFVDMPDSIEFDAAMVRGSDRLTINVVVCVGDAVDRVTRDKIAAYAAGSGAGSIKSAIESASNLEARVTSVSFRPVVMGGSTYFGAVFAVDVII
jgi:hypothetical protein